MTRSVKRWVSLSLLALLSILAISACGGGDSSTGSETSSGSATSSGSESTGSESSGESAEGGEPIVFAQVGGLTGILEAFDAAVGTGIQISVDHINAEGGVLGGRELVFKQVDTTSDTAKSVSSTTQAIEEGANFIMVPSDYNFGAPVARFAESQGKLAFGFIGSSNFGYEGVGPGSFNLMASTQSDALALADWAYNEKGIKHPYLLEDTENTYGVENCKAFEAAWDQVAGAGTIAGKDTFQQADTSVRSQIATLQANKTADAVMICSFPPGGVTPIREMRAAGIDLPVITGAGFEGNYWQNAVPNLNNVYSQAVRSVDETGDKQLEEAIKEYEKLTGEPPSTGTFLAGGYMAAELLADGIEAAGSAEPEAVAKAIDSMGEVNLFGRPTTYTAECHVPNGSPSQIVQYTGSEGKVIATVTPNVEEIPNKKC